jgi:hypothetical protein
MACDRLPNRIQFITRPPPGVSVQPFHSMGSPTLKSRAVAQFPAVTRTRSSSCKKAHAVTAVGFTAPFNGLDIVMGTGTRSAGRSDRDRGLNKTGFAAGTARASPSLAHDNGQHIRSELIIEAIGPKGRKYGEPFFKNEVKWRREVSRSRGTNLQLIG